MSERLKSRRGVYKDLNLSPYEYISPYGDSFKFSSKKKLEMYTRDIPKEIDRISKTVGRLDLEAFLPREIIGLIYRTTYRAFYRKIEG